MTTVIKMPGRTIWLFLLVIFVGIQFGAGLYEKAVIVPQWGDLPGDLVVGAIDASGMRSAGRVFWPFVSPVVGVLAIVNLVLAWRSQLPNRRWWIAGAALMCGYAIFSYSYFVPEMLVLQSSAGAWPAARVESVVSTWTGLNYVRMTIGAAGWFCALRALWLASPVEGRARPCRVRASAWPACGRRGG
jgi:hypothetical protein